MITSNKRCAVCDKTYARSFSRSHSLQTTARKLQPNLQWFRLANGQRARACTKCIKSASKNKKK